VPGGCLVGARHPASRPDGRVDYCGSRRLIAAVIVEPLSNVIEACHA